MLREPLLVSPAVPHYPVDSDRVSAPRDRQRFGLAFRSKQTAIVRAHGALRQLQRDDGLDQASLELPIVGLA
jgi:hypothetical protein